ncbi:hypothetical protein SAMN05192570_0208 [Brevundimonas viscosa]|uniref:Transposase n=1 Tax=Brevundimonas viscosa TaxID=871741 RepID=A0A1I6TNP8_9CAUL|nr:hypothetical protein SAMN05192570_0208 [Brevundimonas viscosa]
MGQVLHGSATTTHAVRAAIQRSKAPLKELAARHGLNHKTVAKWRKRAFVHDAPMGPKTARSTVLTPEEEAIVAFRRHTLLPPDCLYALQATLLNLTRSSLHRCLKRHGISRLPVGRFMRPPLPTWHHCARGATTRVVWPVRAARDLHIRAETNVRGHLEEGPMKSGDMFCSVACASTPQVY